MLAAAKQTIDISAARAVSTKHANGKHVVQTWLNINAYTGSARTLNHISNEFRYSVLSMNLNSLLHL